MKTLIRPLVCGAAMILGAIACSIQIPQSVAVPLATQLPSSAAPYGPSSKGGGGDVALTGKIPVTWESLHLTGRLVYLIGHIKGVDLLVDIVSLDLVTGDVQTIFETPVDAWVDAAIVSPDGKQLIISYTPPAGAKFGSQDALYLLPLDGSKPPQLLFAPASDNDRYYQPVWAPDGKTIYFTHLSNATNGGYEVMKVSLPDGHPIEVAGNAYWPAVSTDGSTIAFVTVDLTNKVNRLFVARADGSSPQEISLAGASGSHLMDAPLLLPGGQNLLFSAPATQFSIQENWADRLLGVGVASAHAAIPSDWWEVPLQGGAPTRVTHLEAYSLFGTLSPDKRYVASFSSDRIFVMKPDGTELTQVVNSVGGIAGTVSWSP